MTFAILAPDSCIVVGQVRFVSWARLEREAEVGCWIGRRYWGRGFGSDALRVLCRFGFQQLRLHRITASVVVGNQRSLRMLESAGFRREGRSRRAARVAGRWVDVWHLGLLRGELRNARRQKARRSAG